jgi:hypothetical protein
MSVEWMAGAVCREDPDAMFPHPRNTDGIRRAQALCSRCPVFGQCQVYSAKVKPTDGVWAARLRVGRPTRRVA